MFQHRRVGRAAVALAAFATFAMGTSAFAADGARAGSSLSLAYDGAPRYLDENAPGLAPGAPAAAGAGPSLNAERAPLMALLAQTGAGRTLDDARVNIYGHIEGSYTYNTDNPSQNLNLGRVFDINDNRGEMNQLDLNLERIADPHQFDLGGRVELLYGSDARFIHGSDFIDYDNKNVANSTRLYNGPEYQFDIPQIYVDLTLPIGEGIRIRAGKFLFFKQIDPNASVFYSHSFTFGGALPFTLTGVTAQYAFNDRITVEGGFSRGWGQTLTDNNGAIDGMGRVSWKINQESKFSLALITGPEQN
ncbi:MAG TPA: outer membrane beta-barrel protein, partial [Humisphaera sp.]|nr:outer membrane beta-barrel protein [Humisphaera sp.]